MTNSYFHAILWAALLLAGSYYLFWRFLQRTSTRRLREFYLVSAMKNHVVLFGVLASNFIFFLTCLLQFTATGNEENFGLKKTVNEDEPSLSDRIVDYRDKKDFLGIALMPFILAGYFWFAFSPFSRDVVARISYPNNFSESAFDPTETTAVGWVDETGRTVAIDLSVCRGDLCAVPSRPSSEPGR